ncbi:hypothetical protein [Emcibacter sp. SYSU 3D8]|uniref:hypothetical protein n=1 Tax=Emcibacter sp. SYSU 3D8 TaxID=3133969 RepID=UPI0031FECC19
MNAADIGFLILRLNIAAVFLLAAAVHSSPRGWHGLIVDTGILLRGTPLAGPGAVKLMATVALIAMYAGALSVLIGIEPRVGALLLAPICAGGFITHLRNRDDAMAMGNKINESAPPALRDAIGHLAFTAFIGHFAAALRNVVMTSLMVFLFLAGAGNWIVSDHLGALLFR